MATDNVVQFPKRARVAAVVQEVAAEPPAPPGASPIRKGLWRGKALFSDLLQKLGFPGSNRNLKLQDALMGQDIVIEVRPAFTRVTVNGRDYDYYHLVWSRTAERATNVHSLHKHKRMPAPGPAGTPLP